jgi:GntR family transcriptional regulator
MINPNLIPQVQDGASLPEIVSEHLRTMINDGTLEPGTRLPNEPELARILNVSRSTLRAALDRLTREGFVTRRRGVGTFVANRPLVVNNLNINEGVTDLIRSIGAEPGVAELHVGIETASSRLITHLEIEPDSSVISVERVRTADDKRVIFSHDSIPMHVLETPNATYSVGEIKQFLEKEQSIYAFFKEMLRLQVDHAIAWLRPVTASSEIAEKLGVPIGSGLLYFEQLDFDANGNPILFTDEYHVAEAFTFAVYREG